MVFIGIPVMLDGCQEICKARLPISGPGQSDCHLLLGANRLDLDLEGVLTGLEGVAGLRPLRHLDVVGVDGLMNFREFHLGVRPLSQGQLLLLGLVRALVVTGHRDDPVGTLHLQLEVGVIQDRHELGEGRPPEESVVAAFEGGDLKHGFSMR